MAKRFVVKDSTITDGYCVFDSMGEYAFVPNENKHTLMSTVKCLNELNDENEELRLYNRAMVKDIKDLEEQNNRQAEQLDRLYKLIEAKDWRTLSDIIDDFKRCEEQLQKEWR